MRPIFRYLCCTLFVMSNISFAQDPVVNRNVHVLRNAQPSQCTSTMNSSGVDVSSEDISGAGEGYTTEAGVQSCTGCAFDSASGDCVCQMCYVYYN